MRVDSVMSLVSMIAAAVTAIASVRGEWSWVGRARARLELVELLLGTVVWWQAYEGVVR